jgi:putative ABC transport system permease protein
MALLRRILNVLRRERLVREFDEELQFHSEMRARRAREKGLGPAETQREVARRMGNLSLAKEEMADARGIPWLASSVQDLRHGVTLLWRDARVSGLIVLVLALGIGGTSAIFTLLKAAFLDPLPFRDASRLVTIHGRYSRLGVNELWPTIPEFIDIQSRSRSFDHMAFLDYRDYQITGSGEPVRVFAARVTASFFPLLGVTASIGRTFNAEENRPGSTSAVVITNSFWRTRLAGDPAVLGRALQINGAPHAIVGVLPPDFTFDYPTLGVPEPAEVYVPFEMSDIYMLRSGPHANVRRVRVLARLRDGATSGQATGDLEAAAGYLAATYPNLYRGPRGEGAGFSLEAVSLRTAIVGRQRALLWLLLGSAAALLLIACANAAQLLLARGLRRAREVAIRSALGASRGRLIRQFLMEGIALAAAGGAIGLVLSGAISQAIVRLFPAQTPLFANARIDLRVIGFTAAVALLSAVAFAVLPALKTSAWTPGPSLTTRLSVAEGNRWRHAIIAVEAALSVFLLCGAGLVGQNLWKLVSAPSGFDPENVTVMQMRLPYAREQALNPSPMLAYREYLERIYRVPGVTSAAIVTGLPMRGAAQTTVRLEGVDDRAGAAQQRAFIQTISPGYFRTLRVPLLAGRDFNDDDRQGRPAAAIVNREFARRSGLGPNPIGRRLLLGAPVTIVGVVADARMSALNTTLDPQIFVSYLQVYDPNVYLVVRSDGAAPLRGIKDAIYSSYPDQAVFNMLRMQDVFSRSMAEPRFQVFLIGAFSLIALAMAASGMYSVISCLVSQRTSEVAIRIALGADRAAIVRTILGSTSAWVLAGLVVGLGLSAAARNTIRSLSAVAIVGSPWMYVSVAVFFIAVTLAAAHAPVRRASRLDPAMALRCE